MQQTDHHKEIQENMTEAKQFPDDAPSLEIEKYLVFSLNECEFAIKAEHVQGVERFGNLTPVPNTPPWLKGVMNLRGSIASVVDLRAFLDVEELPASPRTRLVLLHYNEMMICVVVDSVSGIVPIAATHIVSSSSTTVPQWVTSYTAGSAMLGDHGGHKVVLLDAPRLLFSHKMQHY